MGKLYGIEDYERLVFGGASEELDESGGVSEELDESGAFAKGADSHESEGFPQTGDWQEEWELEDVQDLESLDGEWQPEELPEEVLEELMEEDFPPLTIDLVTEDGRRLSYEAVGVFLAGGQQYMALHPTDGAREGEIPIELMRCLEGEEDALVLEPIDDEKEYEAAAEAFHRLL